MKAPELKHAQLSQDHVRGEAPRPSRRDLVSPPQKVPYPFPDIVIQGLRRAVTRGWPRAAVQRCGVHKLRNLQAKAPAHARAEVTADFHRIVYAESGDAARAAYARFERTWAKWSCPRFDGHLG